MSADSACAKHFRIISLQQLLTQNWFRFVAVAAKFSKQNLLEALYSLFSPNEIGEEIET